MEENEQFTVKQTQAGDDSGYSCTSTQSKYSVKSCHSQSASSGDSCFDERRSTTLESNGKGKMSTLKSKTTEQPNQTALRYVSGLETTINQESNNKNSKSKQINTTESKPKVSQIFSTDELKQPLITPKIEFDEPKHINEDTKGDHDQSNTNFLHLANLCQSYHDHKNTKSQTSNLSNKFAIKGTVIKEVNDQEILLKEMIESNEIHDDLFGVIVSMSDGIIINTSNSIQKTMGYPSDKWQGRSFVDFIHPKDRVSFISYVTSVLADPYTEQDDTSSVTFLKSKNNDGFYCNMRRYRGLNSGYSITQSNKHYQVCKLTMSFKDLTYLSALSSTHLAKRMKIPRPQLLLIVNAQLIHSAYTCPEEKPESPVNFITKHNALFEWCYVDHLIVSQFGYLPQNIIGKSIFEYYDQEDVTIIKEVHKNMTKNKSISYTGKPYRFKCQNGDFALVETEWSNFVNPWSGRAEFFIGKHKVIQGPINPDVTNPAFDFIPEEKIADDEKNTNETYKDFKQILNKNIYEATETVHQLNNTTNFNTDLKNQISKKVQDLGLCMNCLIKNIDTSIDVPLEVEVQPETCGSFSDHGSVMLGETSPHHRYENKSSSGTPPSYSQLNYNNNIQRFFTNSLEDLTDQSFPLKETAKEIVSRNPIDIFMYKAQQDTLLQSLTPSSSNNHFSTSYSEQYSSKRSQQPLTQKVLLRHNKKMEDDLVKQHKNNTKINKASEKQKQNEPEETKNIVDITHGIKRSNSSAFENNSCELTKKKHTKNSNPTIVTKIEDNVTVTHTVARATQIWPPCQITRDSQTTADLPRLQPDLSSQVHCYNAPFGNNVMPVKNNEYESTYTLMGPCEKNEEPLSNQLQSLSVPLYATIHGMNDIPQNSQILQPYLHYYHNQLLLQQPYQNMQCKPKTNQQNEPPAPVISNAFHQTMIKKKTQDLQVNQEEVITSSDSEYKKEYGSLRSSSGWMYEDSSFYSSNLNDKTESSDREDCSWPSEFNKTKFADQFIKRQPFWMENIESTPDLIFRYQIELGDINEILRKDTTVLNTLTQPLLVNEQLKQLCMEINFNGSGEDECLNLLEYRKERSISPEWP